MPAFSRIVVVGVGLIGGSIGRAARERGLAEEVVGLVRSEKSAERAMAASVVDTVTTDPAEACLGADLVVICTPVGSVVSTLEALLPHLPAGVIATDAGSTKKSIVQQAEKLLADTGSTVRFVGSHPLAGDHRTGPEFARADLFQGKTVVVTNSGRTYADAFSRTIAFWGDLGAHVVFMSPSEHDAAVARSSHLPHLIASLLAASTPEEALPLTASGWRDTTRVAAGDPDLWLDILRDNRDDVLAATQAFGRQLDDFAAALDKKDWQTVRKVLEEGKRLRDAADDLPANDANTHE